MRNILKYMLWALIPCMFIQFSYAQEVSAVIKLDTTKLKLGEQTRVQLILKHPKQLDVKWPAIPDTLGKLEILQKSRKDTLANNEKTITERQSFTLTVFDSGFYVIPPFQFTWKEKNDTTLYKTETQALLLSVKTVPVDTTKNFKDIKKPLDVPFNWIDALPYIGGGILLILIVWGLWYWNKKRKKTPEERIVKAPKIPAHELALLALKELEKEKLWQGGSFKKYYSGISDIVRAYIENRYQVQALEQTTFETMQSLQKYKLSNTLQENLKSMLELSDLVKFAKLQPIASENENCLKQAYDFIQGTIPNEDFDNPKQEETK